MNRLVEVASARYFGTPQPPSVDAQDADPSQRDQLHECATGENVDGSCAASPHLGFLYNNYMSAFNYTDPSHPDSLRPNAVPWASVAPTVVLKHERPWLAIGSPGSERIPPAILQVLLRLRESSPLAAVDAPRIHCSLQGVLSAEATRMPTNVLDTLAGAGFELNRREPYSFYMGCVQMVIADGEHLVGVADPRRDGAAAGPSPPKATAK